MRTRNGDKVKKNGEEGGRGRGERERGEVELSPVQEDIW